MTKSLHRNDIYYIREERFLTKAFGNTNFFLNFAPDIGSVVFSCTMVLIVCFHLSLLSTGGFSYTLSPVPPIPLCYGTPGVPGEFNHPFLQQIGGCLNLKNSEVMGLLFLGRGGHVLNVMTNQKKFGEEKRVFQNLPMYFSFFADIY